MSTTAVLLADLTGELRLLGDSWRRSLTAQNKAERTIETYLSALRHLALFLDQQGMPTLVGSLSREHVEAFIADQLAHSKPATANNRYRGLQSFFRYCIEEGEIADSPMRNMKPPKIPETPPPVLSDDQLKALLKITSGTTFNDRRDHAIIMLLLDCGMRRSELANLTIADVDWDRDELHVLGKGSRPRTLRFGNRAGLALRRYQRKRDEHRDAKRPELWLGHAGPMTPNGVYQVVRDRAKEAGLIGNVYTHLFRHSFADRWLRGEGAQEGDLMQLAGWKSRTMLARYGASVASERAREAHKRFSPGDRL